MQLCHMEVFGKLKQITTDDFCNFLTHATTFHDHCTTLTTNGEDILTTLKTIGEDTLITRKTSGEDTLMTRDATPDYFVTTPNEITDNGILYLWSFLVTFLKMVTRPVAYIINFS